MGASYALTGNSTSWLANVGQVGSTTFAPIRASGYFSFSAQPANGNTITVNGVTFTFVTSGATGNQANIGANLNATINNMVSVLNASANGSVNVARYANSGGTSLQVLYKTAGTSGNSFTLAKVGTNITVSASTLTSGAAAGPNPWEIRVPSVDSNWWPIQYVNSRSAIVFSNDGYSPAFPGIADLYDSSLAAVAYEIRANYHAVIMRLTGYTMRTTEYKNTAVI